MRSIYSFFDCMILFIDYYLQHTLPIWRKWRLISLSSMMPFHNSVNLCGQFNQKIIQWSLQYPTNAFEGPPTKMKQLVFKCSDVLMNVTNYLAFMSTAKCHNFIHFIWQKKFEHLYKKKQGWSKWIPLLNLMEPIADFCGIHWWSTSFIHLDTLLIFSLQICIF